MRSREHMRDPLVTKPVIKLDDIVEDAQFAFWEEVVKHLPLAESGDFDFGAAHHFDLAIGQAIKLWWKWNASVPYDLDNGLGEILQGADCNCETGERDCGCEVTTRPS
jgi:hypothetical protein